MPAAKEKQMIDISGVHIAQCYGTFCTAGLKGGRSLANDPLGCWTGRVSGQV